MTLRERLMALADEHNIRWHGAKVHCGPYEALALAAARTALDDAAKACEAYALGACRDKARAEQIAAMLCRDDIRAIRSQLDQSEGRG